VRLAKNNDAVIVELRQDVLDGTLSVQPKVVLKRIGRRKRQRHENRGNEGSPHAGMIAEFLYVGR
jgi:hypothetical protein